MGLREEHADGLIWLLLPLHMVMNAMMIAGVCDFEVSLRVVLRAKFDALKGLRGAAGEATCSTNRCDRANRRDLARAQQIAGAGKLTSMRLSASIVTYRSERGAVQIALVRES